MLYHVACPHCDNYVAIDVCEFTETDWADADGIEYEFRADAQQPSFGVVCRGCQREYDIVLKVVGVAPQTNDLRVKGTPRLEEVCAAPNVVRKVRHDVLTWNQDSGILESVVINVVKGDAAKLEVLCYASKLGMRVEEFLSIEVVEVTGAPLAWKIASRLTPDPEVSQRIVRFPRSS